jgi:hypothetical protein
MVNYQSLSTGSTEFTPSDFQSHLPTLPQRFYPIISFEVPIHLYLIFEKSSSTNWIFSLFRTGFLT